MPPTYAAPIQKWMYNFLYAMCDIVHGLNLTTEEEKYRKDLVNVSLKYFGFNEGYINDLIGLGEFYKEHNRWDEAESLFSKTLTRSFLYFSSSVVRFRP